MLGKNYTKLFASETNEPINFCFVCLIMHMGLTKWSYVDLDFVKLKLNHLLHDNAFWRLWSTIYLKKNMENWVLLHFP